MPKITTISKILIIGSGPIVIGQGCEFDYSGTQAIIALKEEGYSLVLVNPNPATMMSTPSLGAKVYMEPLTVAYIEKIIELEQPDALIGTMGGQTALNLTLLLHDRGILEKYNIRLLGVSVEAIRKGEERETFKDLVTSIGLKSPSSALVKSIEQARSFFEKNPLPLILRPSLTLGGEGGGIIEKEEDFDHMVRRALKMSLSSEVLIETSLLGWMETEMEVIRDSKGNAIVVCSIENIDPMGTHTGDSVTIAPIINLSDTEYQAMRNASLAIIKEVGILGGGVNVQFALNPMNGDMVVIEMNPRVSRSSALASKATGYAIARVSAKLAVGYTLSEVMNEITQTTSSALEPALDYIAVKVPRFEIEKFPFHTTHLGTQMKSVGESLAIGRTFIEGLNKAIRGIGDGREGLVPLTDISGFSERDILPTLSSLHPYKIHALYSYLTQLSEESAQVISHYHPFVIHEVAEQVAFDIQLSRINITESEMKPLYIEAKMRGMSNVRIAQIMNIQPHIIDEYQKSEQIFPTSHYIDTCSGEADVATSYCYLTYNEKSECSPLTGQTRAIIASGPNRVGQGLEFDTCCTLSSLAYRKKGIQTIMINNNPETVSTDYSISDKLYIENVQTEEVLHILREENVGSVVVQLGGQAPLKMLPALQKEHINICGTSYESLMISDQRTLFSSLLDSLGIKQSRNRSATSYTHVSDLAKEVGYPLLARPSHVLGGEGMAIIYSEQEMEAYLDKRILIDEDSPLLLDSFLEDAFEYDVDAISDGENLYICGILQHIEAAGVHSGDSAAVFPPYMLSFELEQRIKETTHAIAVALGIQGFMNVQLASIDNDLYVIEVNPRASRTIPFLSKMSNVDIMDVAVNVWEGINLIDQHIVHPSQKIAIGTCKYGWAIKEAVFSFTRFSHLDPVLGPNMKSTGEVAGIGRTFGEAYYKSQVASHNELPISGKVCVSVNSKDRENVLPIVKEFIELGFAIAATRGTAQFLFKHGILCEVLLKEGDGQPNIINHMEMGAIDLLINTPMGQRSQKSSLSLRQVALSYSIPYTTTLSAARAALEAIKYRKQGLIEVTALDTL